MDTPSTRTVCTGIFAALMTLAFCIVPEICHATPPLQDTVEYDGIVTQFWGAKNHYPEIPESPAVIEIRQNSDQCSAGGAPRGKWKISDGKLWLVRLFQCGGDISLETAYGGNGEAMFADWINGAFSTHRGKLLCGGPYMKEIYEKTITFRFAAGVLIETIETSNVDDPAVPKPRDPYTFYRCL